MSLAQRVVHRYLLTTTKIARIVLIETNGTLEVSGKYNEMQTVIPRLKGLGFQWDPGKKVWHGSSSKLKALKRKNLDKLIAEANGEPVPGADPEEAERKQEAEALKKKEYAAKINAFLEKRKNGWSTLGLRLMLHGPDFEFCGNTFPVKDTIKHWFPSARFQTNTWVVRNETTTDHAVEGFIAAMDKLEAATQAQPPMSVSPVVPSSPVPAKQPQRRTNQKSDHCRKCGGWVIPGQGWLEQEFDDEDEKWQYYVIHQDKKVCETILEEARIRQHEAHTKSQARRNLRELAVKPEHYVHGNGLQPHGKEFVLDETGRLHGGGEWVVVEPGEQHFWYVINRGADGDDWSHNNVMTGGAGAVGYRLPLTPEAQVLLDVATGTTHLERTAMLAPR